MGSLQRWEESKVQKKNAHITGKREGVTVVKSQKRERLGHRWARTIQMAPPPWCYTLQHLEPSQLQRIHIWLKVAAMVRMWFTLKSHIMGEWSSAKMWRGWDL